MSTPCGNDYILKQSDTCLNKMSLNLTLVTDEVNWGKKKDKKRSKVILKQYGGPMDRISFYLKMKKSEWFTYSLIFLYIKSILFFIHLKSVHIRWYFTLDFSSLTIKKDLKFNVYVNSFMSKSENIILLFVP